MADLGPTRSRPEHASADLHARLEAYELALEASGIGVWEVDLAGEEIRWSRQIAALTGTTDSSFAARTQALIDLVHPDDVQLVVDRAHQALEGSRDFAVDVRVVGGAGGAGGAPRWMRSTAVVVRDPTGRPLRMIGNQRDITPRKTTEVELGEARDLLEYVLEISPIVLFAGTVEDRAFVPRYASSNSERVQGWSAEAFLTGAVDWQSLLHPDDAEQVLAANQRALDEGRSAWETRLRKPDGDYGHYRTELRVRDEDGATTYVGCTLDITEPQRMERQLRQAQRMEAVGQLAGGIAHDFNNLLLAIGGYTELARAASTPGGAADQALVEVERAAGQAAAVVQQLLAFSRGEELRPVAVHVGEALLAMRDLLGMTAGDGRALALRVAPDTGSVLLGKGQLEQLLLNLLVNARDAMPWGGTLTVSTDVVDVRSETSAADGLPPGAHVRLRVIDSGEGMTPEVRAKAFEPFFTTKPAGSGTGLGLAAVYGIVSKAGGRVDLTSAKGEGTTVEIHLPRHVDHDPPGAAGEPRTSELADQASGRPSHSSHVRSMPT